jgi:hypothetical protein
MSRIVIVILIYHRHKPIDSIPLGLFHINENGTCREILVKLPNINFNEDLFDDCRIVSHIRVQKCSSRLRTLLNISMSKTRKYRAKLKVGW